jgi:lysophospholipase L1-like esterase
MVNRSTLMVLGLCLAAGLGRYSPALAQNAGPAWVTAWATSQQGLGTAKVTNATVRLIARVTIPGEGVRVRLDNTFGTAPVTFDKATIGVRVRGATVAEGLVKPLTFGGKGAVTIPQGGSVESDAVAMHVDALQDVAVSLFVASAEVQPSQHNNAVVTSYLTENGAGDQTGVANGKAFTGQTASMFWLKSIDVRPTAPATAIVAFGDSITDGTCSTLDAHDRWEDVVAQRLALQGTARAVINEGIGGNTVTRANLDPPAASPTGVERLDRDVLSHAGVTHVVLFMGTNDIRREAPAAQVIDGIKNIISRVKARGIKIIGATIIPRHTTVPGVETTGWNDAKTKIRNEINEWMRKGTDFDAVLDFDKIVRSTNNPDLMAPAYNCSDGVHPSPIGYFQMGKSVDLGLFGAK